MMLAESELVGKVGRMDTEHPIAVLESEDAHAHA